jgi:hypothetical protein
MTAADEIMRDCLTEALMTADEQGITHGHAVVLVLVDQDSPRNRVKYTLDEARAKLAIIETTLF